MYPIEIRIDPYTKEISLRVEEKINDILTEEEKLELTNKVFGVSGFLSDIVERIVEK